ncbi:metal-dependent hydrolase [Klebsiella pneumoniae]
MATVCGCGAWHAIEEMEHRDVAFDVMKQVGEVPESTRRFVLVLTTVLMFGFTLYRTNIMLKCDGFSPRERLLMNLKGLPWFFGKNGTLTAMKKQYISSKPTVLTAIKFRSKTLGLPEARAFLSHSCKCFKIPNISA